MKIPFKSKSTLPDELLNVNDAADLLKISPIKIQRWLHQGKVPFKTIDDEHWLNKQTLLKWAESHNIHIDLEQEANTKINDFSLSKMVENSGIIKSIKGSDVYSVITESLKSFDMPDGTNLKKFTDELLLREELAPTAIGNEAAIPHSKKLQSEDFLNPYTPLVILDEPIDFNSPDGKPVSVLFFLFSSSIEVHLKLLSRIAHCVKNKSFIDDLKNSKDLNQVSEIIHTVEKSYVGL